MKSSTIVLKAAIAVIAGVGCAALGSTEEKINKSFTAQPGGTVVVDVDFGAIEVSASEGGQVVVDAWRKIGRRNKTDEEAFLRDNPVSIVQEGSNITVRCKGKHSMSWGWRNQNEAKYAIQVPARFNAKVGTAGGGITVTGLTGEVRAHTSGGGLSFTHLNGPLEGETSGGSIRLDRCEGALRVKTSGGQIDVLGGGGSVEGHTSGGNVTVKEFGGPAHVGTSGGGIRMEKVAGEINGSTSGGSIQAQLVSPVEGPVKLSTSGGGVTVLVSEQAAFELDAETSGGGVRSDLPVTTSGKPEHHRLKGPVNGGGKVIFLRTSGGSIQIKKL